METSLLAVVKNGKIQLPSPLSIPEGTKVLIIPIPLNKEIENNNYCIRYPLRLFDSYPK